MADGPSVQAAGQRALMLDYRLETPPDYDEIQRGHSLLLPLSLLALERVFGKVGAAACYDALNCAAVTNADERLACYDALAKTQSARPPAAPAVAPAAAASDGAIADAGFGAAPHKSPPTPKGPEQIKALVAEVNVDRLGTVTVSLENGQTWTFHDPEPRIKSGDQVTIRRASLGSYLMTIPGRHTYRVQRTQ